MTFQLKYFILFAINHDQLIFDLVIYGTINSIGSMFTYKLISIFRQHVYPLVSIVRKCITVCINALWFGHQIVLIQWLGILMVFSGVLIEIMSNYQILDRITANENIKKR